VKTNDTIEPLESLEDITSQSVLKE